MNQQDWDDYDDTLLSEDELRELEESTLEDPPKQVASGWLCVACGEEFETEDEYWDHEDTCFSGLRGMQ